MNDYSYGSGWADGGSPVDYGISPYGAGYSNTGFQVPSFNNSNNGYSSSGTNYSLGTSYGGSSGGFSTPSFGNASNGFMGSATDYGLSPYQPLYSNMGIMPRNTWDQQMSADSMRNNYGGTSSGGDYIPYPANYFNPSYTPPAEVAPTYSAPPPDPYAFDSSGYNTFGFNGSGIDREGYSYTGFNQTGINREGLDTVGRNYNPGTGLNYKTGGFNYDSKLSPFEGSSFTTAATADTGGAASTEFSPNSMVKEDLRRKLERPGQSSGQQPQGNQQGGQALQSLVSGLNSLFSSKNAGKTASTLAGLYQGQQAKQATQEQGTNIAQQQALVTQQQTNAAQQQAFAQKQASDLASMFGQDSSYAQALRKQLDRKDAQGGRRSQYGTREVELQARLAEAASRIAPNIAGYNKQAFDIGSGIVGMGKDRITNGTSAVNNQNQNLATNGQQLSRVIDLAGTAGVFDGLGNMFKGIGNNSNTNGNRDTYDYSLRSSSTPTTSSGGNFWDKWFD